MKETPGKPGSGLGDIVLTAAGLEGEERERYLQEVAAMDSALATQARQRLAAGEDATEAFLRAPAFACLDPASSNLEESDRPVVLPAAERYELGESLGRGGMGRVVVAFDRQLGRSVALKFLTHQDPAIQRLFLEEARSQARVHHPHVLEVYDGGELEGQPYISMRYIAGGTLAEVGPSLTLEKRVRLLAQAAEGLHAAHREGLLHRDVKPSNILVEETRDGELQALVSDFGLASEMEAADSFEGETVAGSPHYIAPERLEGSGAGAGAGPGVDRRSDIYSLGITLYSVLTGAMPFSGKDTVDLLRQVVFEDLPSPREHLPSLPAELEAIILRCTARDPQQRYASARAVAADLQRYLDGEVVEAYAAGLAYRLTRFVLRNKVLTGLAVVAVAALLVASVAVAVFAVRADAARERAELRQGQAEELIRFMVVDLRDKLDSLGRLDVLDEVGSAATEYFASVPEGELSEAELLRRSRMLYQIGEVRIRQGDLAGAVTPMADSLALAERLSALSPEDGERLFELGQGHFWVGFVHWEQGNLEAARGPFEEYLEVSRRLTAIDPKNLDWRRELSYAHSNLGSQLQAEGSLDEALAQFRSTLEIDQELVRADPMNVEAQSELAASHNTVGRVLQDLGKLHEAGTHLAADLGIREGLLAMQVEAPRLRDLYGTSHSRMGSHLSILGDWSAAGRHFDQARAIFSELVAHDPANSTWRFKLALSRLLLGRVAYARADLESANRETEAGLKLLEDLLATDTPHAWLRAQAIGFYHSALVERAFGRPARPRALAAVEILEGLATSRPTDRVVNRWLSQSYLVLGSLEDGLAAETAFERAVETIEPFARDSADPRLLAPWVTALRCLGRLGEAQVLAATMQASAYSEPGLSDLCEVTRESDLGETATPMSSPPGVLRDNG